MKSIFEATKENPYHVSVGAVVLNNDNLVCTLRYKNFKGFGEIYTLMRETLENGESLSDALYRGLYEECGITGNIIRYMGSLVGNFFRDEVSVEKTTLYFLIKIIDIDTSLATEHVIGEGVEIEWLPVDFLILKMKEQEVKTGWSSLNESQILNRLQKFDH